MCLVNIVFPQFLRVANSEEHKRLERAHERCKHVLAYVNQAVKECENYHKAREIFKKVDRKPFDNVLDPTLNEVKVSFKTPNPFLIYCQCSSKSFPNWNLKS